MKNLDAYADSCVKFKDKIKAILADIGLVRSDDYDIIYTDEYLPYNQQLHRHGFIHEYVNHSQKEYARGDIYVNNCECRSNLYQLWIRKFMGINKCNLQTYSKAFQFIHNIRRMIDRRDISCSNTILK